MQEQEDLISLAERGAQAIGRAFELFQQEFTEITCRARQRFIERDWHGLQRDMADRLDLYTLVVREVVAEIRDLLGETGKDKAIWVAMKAAYQPLISQRADMELAETFFNSVTRRIFTTVGVDPQIEFVDSDFEAPPPSSEEPIYQSYSPMGTMVDLFKSVLRDFPFEVGYADLELDAELISQRVKEQLNQMWGSSEWDRAEFVKEVFYRNLGAYIVGRICRGEQVNPVVLSLRHPDQGVIVDAVLLSEVEVSILFSFTRSYFHVDIEKPYQLIHFLHTLLPRKRVAELYISIGYNKHGKTELYRDMLHHLSTSQDIFDIAPGERGMVMIVFTMPTYDMVFKVIRDRFADPKTVTRQDVLDHYQMVFRHNRAGRLADAQEFEYLSFDLSRFSEQLLNELLNEAPGCVTVQGDRVAIKHLYIERCMTPLNLYVKEAGREAALEAVVDYGNAIKDLAATNIFPGDILIKNFGVTRHGRVVFYDYDELCLLETCKFRRLPPPAHDEDHYSSEPWFYVGKNDIFPEEFSHFLGLTGELKEAFFHAHADLFDVEFWQNMQAQHTAGIVADIFPYKQGIRIHASSLAGKSETGI